MVRTALLLLALALPILGQRVTVTRGPYLQGGTSTGVIVCWRTDVPSASRVRYGAAAGALTSFVDNVNATTEHVLELTGLQAETRYFYSVGTPTMVLAGDDPGHVFKTAPPTGARRPLRIWALGDSGTANANARAVRDGFYAVSGARPPDLWLMLGDNAYVFGTDAEYQAAVFQNMFEPTLRSSVLWPTIGNHDALSSTSSTQMGPYFQIFHLPTGGQAGGMPSGTEAYYSFDWGNVHFVCLDSAGGDLSATGAQAIWLQADLVSTAQDWTVAFWHHPPYSKGSHNSDSEPELMDMRQNFLPILESHGVDLVLSG